MSDRESQAPSAPLTAENEKLLCDEIEVVTLAQHVKYVEQFLNDMYATMIDPCEQPFMKVADMCKLLLKTATEQREQLSVLAARGGEPLPVAEAQPEDEKIAEIVGPILRETYGESVELGHYKLGIAAFKRGVEHEQKRLLNGAWSLPEPPKGRGEQK